MGLLFLFCFNLLKIFHNSKTRSQEERTIWPTEDGEVTSPPVLSLLSHTTVTSQGSSQKDGTEGSNQDQANPFSK